MGFRISYSHKVYIKVMVKVKFKVKVKGMVLVVSVWIMFPENLVKSDKNVLHHMFFLQKGTAKVKAMVNVKGQGQGHEHWFFTLR